MTCKQRSHFTFHGIIVHILSSLVKQNDLEVRVTISFKATLARQQNSALHLHKFYYPYEYNCTNFTSLLAYPGATLGNYDKSAKSLYSLNTDVPLVPYVT